MINKDKVGKKMVSFEKLDLMLGDRAPFLVSLSDGLDNELRIIISPASIGEVGSRNVEPADSILHGILSKCRPITPDQRDQYEIHFENAAANLSSIPDARPFAGTNVYKDTFARAKQLWDYVKGEPTAATEKMKPQEAEKIIDSAYDLAKEIMLRRSAGKAGS